MTFQNGDYVSAEPSGALIKRDHPKVVGRLAVTPSEFMGEEWNVFTVHAEYEDGTDAPVEVDEESIQEASPRRSPKTILEL